MAARVDLPRWTWQIGVAGLALLLGVAAGLNPAVAVAGAIGIAMVALVVIDVTVGIFIFGLLAFIDIGVGGFSPGRLLGILLAVSWLAAIAVRADVREQMLTRHPLFTYAICLFVAWVGAGVVWAESLSAVADYTIRFALNLMILPIAFSAIRETRHAWGLAGVFIAGVLLTTLVNLTTGQGPSSEAIEGGFSRLEGAGFDPNELAATFVAAAVLAAAIVVARAHSRPVRMLALAGGALCLLGCFATGSRTGLVALMAAGLAALFLAGRGRRAPILALTLLVAGSAVAYFALYAPSYIRERITNPGGGTGRTDIWTVGWRMVQDEPVHGVGAGNFPIVSIHYVITPGALERDEFIVETPKVAHNVYLGILAETGAVGLALFLGIVGFCVVAALRAARIFAARGDPSSEILSRAVAIASIGLLTGNTFISDQFSKPLWLLLALGPCLLAIARHRAAEASA